MVFKICGKDLDPFWNHTESSAKDQDRSITDIRSPSHNIISLHYI